MRPIIPPISAPGNVFSDGDPAVQGDGTTVPSVWLNDMQAATINMQTELVNFLAALGVQPSTSDNAQLLATLRFIFRGMIRLGAVEWFNGPRDKIPATFLPADGQIKNRVDFPELWTKINAGELISQSESLWLDSGDAGAAFKNRGRYSLGNGTSTFRLPDLNGALTDSVAALFLRGDAGGRLSTYLGATGQVLQNAAPNITGAIRTVTNASVFEATGGATGAFEGNTPQQYANLAAAPGAPSNYPREVTFNASRSSAVYGRRNTDEVVPNYVMGTWIIRVSYPF